MGCCLGGLIGSAADESACVVRGCAGVGVEVEVGVVGDEVVIGAVVGEADGLAVAADLGAGGRAGGVIIKESAFYANRKDEREEERKRNIIRYVKPIRLGVV